MADPESVDAPRFTGADQLIATAVQLGITTCFANPGTTELHLVKALDESPDMQVVLCAFEGVCSGAADAYARMTARPALGLFHLGPGYANSLANQHNARRHHTPMINIIGDQASWHLEHDAPLTSDIALLGDWAGETRYTTSPTDTGAALSRAVVDVAAGNPRQVSLVVPADHAWGPAERSAVDAVETVEAALPVPDDAAVEAAAAALSTDQSVLIVGGAVISARSARLLDAIRRSTNCAVHLLRVARLELGGDLPDFDELPYFPEPLAAALADASIAVLAGRPEPVTFFGYPDTDSQALPPDCERVTLCDENADLEAALVLLATKLGLDDQPTSSEPRDTEPALPDVDPGELTTTSLGAAVARAIKPGHIVIGESLTSGATYRRLANDAARHTLLGVLGGAIGGGLPTAVGAAVACPDRPVLALQADGSALYTIQSLWTMAREQLDVTVVICANRRYRILDIEFANHGLELSDEGRLMTDLAHPAISFSGLAEAFGVPARQVSTGAELVDALAWASDQPGPHLIEAEL